jgi:hypothetical protein
VFCLIVSCGRVTRKSYVIVSTKICYVCRLFFNGSLSPFRA